MPVVKAKKKPPKRPAPFKRDPKVVKKEADEGEKTAKYWKNRPKDMWGREKKKFAGEALEQIKDKDEAHKAGEENRKEYLKEAESEGFKTIKEYEASLGSPHPKEKKMPVVKAKKKPPKRPKKGVYVPNTKYSKEEWEKMWKDAAKDPKKEKKLDKAIAHDKKHYEKQGLYGKGKGHLEPFKTDTFDSTKKKGKGRWK